MVDKMTCKRRNLLYFDRRLSKPKRARPMNTVKLEDKLLFLA